jgi:hypothetical protein
VIGAATAGTAITGTTSPTIGGVSITITSLLAADFKNDNDVLVLLGGTTAGNIAAGTADVFINSTVEAEGTT